MGKWECEICENLMKILGDLWLRIICLFLGISDCSLNNIYLLFNLFIGLKMNKSGNKIYIKKIKYD